MSKVEFTYGKGGKKVLMARRYAETLRKLGHGTYAAEEGDYKTRMLVPSQTGILVSDNVAKFAEENFVDLKSITGTGKDGRINKSDIEAAIKTKDLV